MRGDSGRVLIVTAGMGAGHVAVAQELGRRLGERGAAVSVLDLIEDVQGAGGRLRRTYRLLLAHAPWLYDAAMRFWARYPAPLEKVTAAGDRRFAAAIRHAIARHNPDVVVSTFNLGSQCLGRMRRRGELAAPVITLVTDPGAHPYWIGAGVDDHLAYLPHTVAELRAMGAPARVVQPLLRPQFAAPPDRDAARAALGLTGRVALVSAGSWAVGGVADTVEVLAGDPDLTVLVLCGRDEQLRRTLAGRPGVVALGWTDDVAGCLAAADVVVDNAGGQTCWEALSLHRSVVLYRPLAGHGRFNARVLAETGLATLATSPAQLRAAARDARPGRFAATGPDAADVVLSRVPARA